MPTLRVAPDLEMSYQVDDFTDPWAQPETILMLHGTAETSAAWYAWVPKLARHFRIVRPDLRGFGGSTPMPRDYPWTIDCVIDDCLRLMDELGIERFHVVSAKIGTNIARPMAARHPGRVITLTVVGGPPPRRDDGAAIIPKWIAEFEEHGVEHWARRTMGRRLGSVFPPEGVEWWIQYMGRTPAPSLAGFLSRIAWADISADIPRIACPTLIIMGKHESSARSVENTRRWQQQIRNSTLLVVPNTDSYHIAASNVEFCAGATLEFLLRNRAA
jgi:pimeloyl-ACP methyl ester carboxylesterase